MWSWKHAERERISISIIRLGVQSAAWRDSEGRVSAGGRSTQVPKGGRSTQGPDRLRRSGECKGPTQQSPPQPPSSRPPEVVPRTLRFNQSPAVLLTTHHLISQALLSKFQRHHLPRRVHVCTLATNRQAGGQAGNKTVSPTVKIRPHSPQYYPTLQKTEGKERAVGFVDCDLLSG